jgi:hypothetical protein
MITKPMVIDAGGVIYTNDPTLDREEDKETFLRECREKGFTVLSHKIDDAEECGCCGYYHFPDIWGLTGDCRDDDARFVMV